MEVVNLKQNYKLLNIKIMGKELKMKKIGVVGVDSGQILITDPCYIGSEWKKTDDNKDLGHEDNKGQFSYGGCCHATLKNKELGGQLNYKLGHAGAGVVSRAGYGDGSYPVYAIYNDEGRVDKLIVDFQTMPGEKNREIFNKLAEKI